MNTGLTIATQVVTVASLVAFFLPPASKFDDYPNFKAKYRIFLIFVDSIAFNKRIWPRSQNQRIDDVVTGAESNDTNNQNKPSSTN